MCDLKPAIQSTTSPWSAVNLKKIAEIDKVQLEPAIWSRDTGQWIPCFGRCQLTITLMSNIKDVCCKLASVKWSIASSMSLKHEPVIWLRELVTLAYMKGRTYVSTDVHDVMAIKPNFLTSMGYHIFLNYGAPRERALRAAPLLRPYSHLVGRKQEAPLLYHGYL